MENSGQATAITVSQLNHQVKTLLEQFFSVKRTDGSRSLFFARFTLLN